MRVVELAESYPPLNELLEVARQQTLRQANHQSLAPIDDFALEVELLRNNKEFMAYLDELSQQKATISLEEVEKELGL